MEIDSLITRAVLTVSEGDSLRDTAVWMIERGVGSAVVLTDGKPSGIITDRAALRAIARGKDASALTVGDLLPGKLTTVLPSLEVLEAARLMRDGGFRHLVVVENSETVGVLSVRDIVRCWTDDGASCDVPQQAA